MSVYNSLRKNNCLRLVPSITSVRNGHLMRGKPPGVARTLEQRLDEENTQDPELTALVNIGLPKLKSSRSEQRKIRMEHLKAQHANNDLEKVARNNTLLINLEEVQREYERSTGQFDLRTIADHYGVFKDLFGLAYFVPRVPLDIKYEITADGLQNPVYNGNIIKPSEAANAPAVSFDGATDPITGQTAKDTSYWTLIASNPDGNLLDSNAECIHWFISNIPNGDVTKGEEIVSYLQPFPPKGFGFQRFVFVLYKQNKKLDFNSYKLAKNDSAKLEKRTFKTLDFYKKFQDDITPAGLAFYQCDWDKSLTKFYHEVLDMKEPVYEYDFPAAYLSDQKFFPLKQPFNLYMEKHRDIKDVNKVYLEKKLSKTHPFEGPEKPSRFPAAHPMRDVPSWQKTEIRKERLRMGRYSDF